MGTRLQGERGLMLLEDPCNRPRKEDGSLKRVEKVGRSERVPGIFRKSEKQDLMNGHEKWKRGGRSVKDVS